jgi:hypothetical protein
LLEGVDIVAFRACDDLNLPYVHCNSRVRCVEGKPRYFPAIF